MIGVCLIMEKSEVSRLNFDKWFSGQMKKSVSHFRQIVLKSRAYETFRLK